MSKANGNGTATVLAKEKKEPRISKHYRAKAWVLIRPKKAKKSKKPELLMNRLPALAPMSLPPPPVTTSTVNATRNATSISLCYTLHSTQAITYVTVKITSTAGGMLLGNPKIVPEWSIDLSGSQSNDVSLPWTDHSLAQPPNSNPLRIDIYYDTPYYQNVGPITLIV